MPMNVLLPLSSYFYTDFLGRFSELVCFVGAVAAGGPFRPPNIGLQGLSSFAKLRFWMSAWKSLCFKEYWGLNSSGCTNN